MTERLPAVTGYIPGPSPKRETRWRAAERTIHLVWGSIRTGRFHGRRIGAFFTTAHPAISTGNRGTQRESRSGGTKALGNGRGMMPRTQTPTLILKITWARSS